MEAQKDSVRAPPKRKHCEATDAEGGNSSRVGLIDIFNNNNTSTLKRRASIFDDIERPYRRSDQEDAPSSFSLASLTQESSGRRRRTTHNSKSRSRSSFPCLESNADASTLSTSRSLFGSLIATTVCNTHDKSNLNTGVNDGDSEASKPREPVSSKAIPTRKSLFGSVMQNVGERSSDCDESSSRTPTKELKSLGKSPNQTPTLRRKWSSFTPEQRRKKGAPLPFASPGGFKMMDFVNTFSPFHKSKNNTSDSNLSAKSPASSESKEWQNTSLVQGVMDWSLPGSLKFDCFPARMVDSVFKKTPETNALGMSKFLQPPSTTTFDSTTTTAAKQGLSEWEAGLFYWQHPAVHPSPFVPVPSNNNVASGKLKTVNWKDGTVSTKKRRTTLSLADAKLSTEASNVLASSVTNQTVFLLQQQKAFTRQRRADWKQSFTSLYWKWFSQLQRLRDCKCDDNQLESVYFYAIGTDHVVLFLGIQETKGVVPKIVFTSSSALFRNKLRQLGVENLCLMESWNGHFKGTAFEEDMMKQGKAKSNAKEPVKSEGKRSKDPNKGSAGTQRTESLQSPTKENQTGNSKKTAPSEGSNSPFVKEELAALRRAQAFGQTVGADVTVSIRRKAAEPKMPLPSIPPLSVTGSNDCNIFFEVYLKMGSSCCISSSNKSTKAQGAKAGVDQKTLASTRDWQVPHDIPLLLSRCVGPFSNATIKSLAVRRDEHHSEPDSPESNDCHYATVEVHGGPVLPCAMKQLFSGMVQAMQEDKRCCPLEDSDSDDSDEETLIGSHNLILRPVPQSTQGEHKEHQTATRHGIIGTPYAQSLNQFHVSNAQEKLAENQVLGMVVWDIAHQHAIAYKMESADPSTSLLL